MAVSRNLAIRAARAEIVAEIGALLKTKPRAHWLALLAQHKVPAGPVNSVDQVSADPELVARGLFRRRYEGTTLRDAARKSLQDALVPYASKPARKPR